MTTHLAGRFEIAARTLGERQNSPHALFVNHIRRLIGANNEPATPVLENRFLQIFCSVGASALLVFGSLILLTSTAPFTSPATDIEASAQDAARISMRGETSPSAQGVDAPLGSVQAKVGFPAQPEEADRTLAAATGKEPDEARSEIAAPPSAEDGEAFAATGMPQDQDAADAGSEGLGSATNDIAAAPEDVTGVAPVAGAASVGSAAPTAGDKVNAPGAKIADMMAELPPRVIASEKSDAASGEIAEVLAALPPAPPPPPPVVVSEKSDAASDEMAVILASLPPTPPPPVTATAEAKVLPAATNPASAVAKIVSSPSPPADDKGIAATAEVMASPAARKPAQGVAAAVAPPPLPKRKPAEPDAPKVAALSTSPAQLRATPKAAAPLVPQREKPIAKDEPKQEAAKTGGLLGIWKPMALAPADKPSVSLSKALISKPSGAAYASQVWSALARHKPRAGQRGSATVSFAIGQSGALGAVRIARSSGNSRVDQLALQTVRSAAPFPAPPSGSASYTIRIDFQ